MSWLEKWDIIDFNPIVVNCKEMDFLVNLDNFAILQAFIQLSEETQKMMDKTSKESESVDVLLEFFFMGDSLVNYSSYIL